MTAASGGTTAPDISATSVGRPDAQGGHDSRRLWLILLGLAAVALIVRLVGVLRGGGLMGNHGFDDSVYFGAAIAFVEGRIPYRDFNILHPPGIIYTLTPFAALGSVIGDSNALAIARVAFMLVGAVNVVLVGLVGRRTTGAAVGIAAAVLYAVWIVPVNIERTAWLVGPQNTLLLLALLALAGRTAGTLTWRRVAVAGACLGVSGAIQVWSALPALVVFGWLVVVLRHEPGRLLRLGGAYVVAGLAALGALLLPVLALAGPRMIQLIIWTQLSRDAGARTNIMERILHLEGLSPQSRYAQYVPDALAVGAFVVALMVVVVIAWRRPETRLWTALLGTKLAFLFYVSVFFRHYAGWIAPEATLLAGSAIVMLYGALRATPQRRVAAVVGALGLALLLVISTQRTGSRIRVSPTSPDLGAARCVTADAPLLLIRTETIRRNLDRDCALLLNPGGLSHILNAERPGPNVGRYQLTAYQDAIRGFFGASDAALFMRLSKLGIASETWSAIEAELPVREEYGSVIVLLRQNP